jgi:hypothetical protein
MEGSSGLTTTLIVIGVAHSDEAGVKLYCIFPAKAVESDAGDQMPAIPLLDVVGKIGKMIGAF